MSDVVDTNVNRNAIYLPFPRYIIMYKTGFETGSSQVVIKTHFETGDSTGRSANRFTVKCNVLATQTRALTRLKHGGRGGEGGAKSTMGVRNVTKQPS